MSACITPLHPPGLDALSSREFQVFTAIAAGERNRDTAARLRVSPKTVCTFRERILQKLGMTTNADIVAFATVNASAVAARAGQS